MASGRLALTEMGYLVNEENMTPREAARVWMAGHRAMMNERLTGD